MSKPVNLDDWKFIYYSPEIDELFSLTVKPEQAARVLELYVEDKRILEHVIYLGEL